MLGKARIVIRGGGGGARGEIVGHSQAIPQYLAATFPNVAAVLHCYKRGLPKTENTATDTSGRQVGMYAFFPILVCYM